MTSPIASIETFIVRYPVTAYFKFFKSIDGKPPMRDTVLVKITDADGNAGWGQSVPSPTWSYETTESVQTTIERHLAPALIGLDAFDSDTIWRVMNRTIAPSFSTGQPICKAGIDLALFDLTGKRLQQSAATRWGRPQCQKPITLSWTIDATRIEDVEASIAEATAAGFHHFNVKVGNNAAFDLAMCAEIRSLAPSAFVWVDANGGYDLATALSVAPKLADLGMAALEQPLPANDLSGFRKLRNQKTLPILMDEPIVSLTDLREFHQLGLLDGVAMKVSRCGGLTEARRIIEYMAEEGLLFFASGLTDPDLSLAASLLLFGLHDLPHPAALNAPQFLKGSLLQTPFTISGDQITAPGGPGLGVEVDMERLNGQEGASRTVHVSSS